MARSSKPTIIFPRTSMTGIETAAHAGARELRLHLARGEAVLFDVLLDEGNATALQVGGGLMARAAPTRLRK